MSGIFCCSSFKPYRPKQLDHESKFSAFMKWSNSSAVATSINPSKPVTTLLNSSAYVVQVVRQKNFGALEWKRYFAVVANSGVVADFNEISGQDIIDANFEKLNSYKNFKCANHNLFFELNLYQKNPVNLHHWRANAARPASSIDLPAKSDHNVGGASTSGSAAPHLPEVKPEAGAGQIISLWDGDVISRKSEEKVPYDIGWKAGSRKHSDSEMGNEDHDDYMDRREGLKMTAATVANASTERRSIHSGFIGTLERDGRARAS
ncbi:hypothetical protein VTL71DRAFT_11035 [Oculimacula yallundae]|uniref:Uncharacterized protein n=1 Tax=Oculimacula yallundae TaxID=86028 RepID=A0ABR4CUY7_9HELO